MSLLKNIQTYFLLLFGVVTIFVSSAVIFDLFGIREKEGNYVPFIVYANMACGYLYLLTFYFNLKGKYQRSFYVLMLATIILFTAFFFLKEHIAAGGAYEEKTIKAMTFRTMTTFLLSGISWMLLRQTEGKKENN